MYELFTSKLKFKISVKIFLNSNYFIGEISFPSHQRELEDDNNEEIKTIEELNIEGFKIPDEVEICKDFNKEALILVLQEFQGFTK